MIYYVDCNSKKEGNGTKEAPFVTISEAAAIAVAGDEILVEAGIYREDVNPINGGTENNRIVYKSVIPYGAVITGAEVVDNWSFVQDGVWKAEIDNALLGEDNPYIDRVYGDWFIQTIVAHRGDVFLNKKSLYEVVSLEEVLSPKRSTISWDPSFSEYTWYTTQSGDKQKTVIYANFHEYDPNKEDVEISVRRHCFYPQAEGVGYITLSGFTVCQAATQWAPPTAYQEGMIGPHWSKGWIIEDCDVFEAKCSGISLGKYLQPGNDNKWSKTKYKDGTQTERDAICQAQREGWSKDKIGSHIIRRCNIHDCGQTGIVGHLGGVFSIIENNHIHHINNKQNLAGAEIGGIKMHAAIDVIIRNNSFHHCTRGLWLDWQAQGTRVTANSFHHNTQPTLETRTKENADKIGEDIFIEVSHGPTLVDNNLLLSENSLKIPTQGLAIVHNLIAGSLTTVGRGTDNGTFGGVVSPRYTPYHVHHGTEIEGFMTILHGDVRFYNNIFVQQPIDPVYEDLAERMVDEEWMDGNMICGTVPFEKYPSEQEYKAQFEGYCGMGSPKSNRYYTHLPVWASGNVYFNGSKAMSKEKDAVVVNNVTVNISVDSEDEKGMRINTDLYEYLPVTNCHLLTTDDLGEAFEPEQKFENPDGTVIVFDTDLFGEKRSGEILPGPFAKKQ